MSIEVFILSIIASLIAAVIIGSTYKIINKNKKTIKQKGNNNNAYMDSKIDINSNNKNKGEK